MEEEKAAAYYEELTRRGEGAARFKQGLGFSSTSEKKSNSEDSPARGAYASSSPFMSKFVKASKTTSEIEKQSQIESIQNKLKRKRPDPARGEDVEEAKPDPKPKSPPLPRVSERDRRRRSRSGSRERRSRRRSRSRDRDSDRRRRRSGSESDDGDGRRRRRSRSPRYRRKERRRSLSRSLSPARERSRGKVEKERSSGGGGGGGGADYSKLIRGYDKMSAAERVKAKMKLQLAETAEKDTTKGMEGWERFEFNKDAPLDDEEVEVADDDAALVNHIGKSFRFSSFEMKREDRIRAAHDDAMFGTSDNAPTIVIDIEAENDNKDSNKIEPPSLLSEKVLAKKQGSWRDRIRQNKK